MPGQGHSAGPGGETLPTLRDPPGRRWTPGTTTHRGVHTRRGAPYDRPGIGPPPARPPRQPPRTRSYRPSQGSFVLGEMRTGPRGHTVSVLERRVCAAQHWCDPLPSGSLLAPTAVAPTRWPTSRQFAGNPRCLTPQDTPLRREPRRRAAPPGEEPMPAPPSEPPLWLFRHPSPAPERRFPANGFRPSWRTPIDPGVGRLQNVPILGTPVGRFAGQPGPH